MRSDVQILQRVFECSRREDLPPEVLEFCENYVALATKAGVSTVIPDGVLLLFIISYLRSLEGTPAEESRPEDDDWFGSGQPTQSPVVSGYRPPKEPTFLAAKRRNPSTWWVDPSDNVKRYPVVGQIPEGENLSNREVMPPTNDPRMMQQQPPQQQQGHRIVFLHPDFNTMAEGVALRREGDSLIVRTMQANGEVELAVPLGHCKPLR